MSSSSLNIDRPRPHPVRRQLNRRDAVVLSVGREIRGFWHRRELHHGELDSHADLGFLRIRFSYDPKQHAAETGLAF